MNFQSAFLALLKQNKIEYQDFCNTIKTIVKKLNNVYYGINDDAKNFVLAGSICRKTAVCFSDIDFCYILPNDVYQRFEKRSGNIQSQLLGEIKSKIEQRYPNSEIKADGQVVDSFFRSRLIELVPSFMIDGYDGYLKYPDTHDNGSWLCTNPQAQKREIESICTKYPLYLDLCKLVRCWKNEQNVKIKGIEIDILVYEFLKTRIDFLNKSIAEIDILKSFTSLMKYLSSFSFKIHYKIFGELNYIDIDFDKFKKKSSYAYTLLTETDMLQLWENCIALFGDGFPKDSFSSNCYKNEQFIQQLFPVKISKHVKLDCEITSDGFRPQSLLNMLKNIIPGTRKFIINKAKTLTFKIVEIDVQEPYDIYWKVRNVGKVAIEKDCIRGNIEKGNNTKIEHSNFHGPHYVECYIVKDGKCIARDKIDVPIE